MKKAMPLIVFFISFATYAQITISQDFNAATSIPSGWTQSRFSGTSNQACQGNSFRTNLYTGTTTTSGWISTPNYTAASNGSNVAVSFDYKVVNTTSLTTGTPAGWGTLQVQISQNNGVNWTTVYTVNDSNHTVSNACSNKSFIIPASAVPNNSDFKMRFLGTWTSGDYYIYIDNILASQSAAVPNCNAVLLQPTNAATNVSIYSNLTWSAATGFPSGYFLSVGTSSNNYNVISNVNVGNVTTYDLPVLTFNTTYYIRIVPFNNNGSASGCTEYTFTTAPAPPIGNVCENPLLISNLPYTTSATTATFGDDYNAAQGSNCGSESQFYLTGDDVVYAYTATFTGAINIVLTPSSPTDLYSGIFVYGSCADIGLNCLAGVANGTANVRTISNFSVVSGQTYYIVISSWAAPTPQSINYTLFVEQNTCTNPTATYEIIPDCSNGSQFFVQTNVSNFGSATSVTVSDNLGSTPVVMNSLGSVQFGPFQNNISVLIYVQNNQNTSCILTSNFITQSECPPSNDNCSGALALTVGPTFTSQEITSANYGALISSVPIPSCGGAVIRDVWYSVIVPNSGNITIETKQEPGGLSDTALAIYSGSCSNLTLLQCDNDSGDNFHALVNLTGRTPGEVLYIRAWDIGGNDFNLFRISAFDCSLGVNTPTGSATQTFCSGATVASLMATGSSIKWYATSTGGLALSNSTFLVNGTTYYASQTVNSCESNSRLAVAVIVTATSSTPTGNSIQTIEVANFNEAILEDLVVSPSSVNWYGSLANAQSNSNVLPLNTILMNGQTYYAVNNNTGCPSPPLAVTVSVVLSVNSFHKDALQVYPMPFDNELHIVDKSEIKTIQIMDILGKTVYAIKPNSKECVLYLDQLQKGAYLLIISNGNHSKSLKIIK